MGKDVRHILLGKFFPLGLTCEVLVPVKDLFPFGLRLIDGAQGLCRASILVTGAAVFAVEILALSRISLAAGCHAQTDKNEHKDYSDHDKSYLLPHLNPPLFVGYLNLNKLEPKLMFV
jgi:hypothetical protein